MGGCLMGVFVGMKAGISYAAILLMPLQAVFSMAVVSRSVGLTILENHCNLLIKTCRVMQ